MASIAAEAPDRMLATLRGSSRRRRKERLVRTLLAAAAGLSVVISISIVLALIFRTINFVSNVELSSLWSGIWRPRQGEFDLISLFYGSLVVTGIAMAVATPLGLGAAAYLSEYAKPGARRKLKPILETLAGVPSVVIGFFALTVINPVIVQDLFGATNTFTMMAAGIGSGSSRSPSWRRWPRTRCSPCRARCAKRRTGSARGDGP